MRLRLSIILVSGTNLRLYLDNARLEACEVAGARCVMVHDIRRVLLWDNY
jgi:hypothetical protein